MKKIYFLIILFNIILTVNTYADSNDYNICATNDDGAIMVNEEASGDFTSFALASSPTSYTLIKQGGGDEDNRGGFCEVTPDNYKIKMFKMGLCKENPWTGFDDNSSNTRSADLSSCIDIFNNPNGKEVNIQPGIEVNLLDTVVLPIGSFPYIYALLDNVVHIKHIQEYARATNIDPIGPDFTILGYSAANNTSHAGKFCYTGLSDANKEFVSTMSNERSFTGHTTLRGFTLPTRFTGQQLSAKFHCGTESEAINENDWFVTIFNSIGSRMVEGDDGSTLTRDDSIFRNAGEQARGFHNQFPTIEQHYYLYNSSDTIATSTAAVEKILFIQSDTNNVVKISEDTTAFKMNFKTNNAIELAVYEDSENSDTLMATDIQGNAIFINIETKTRRSRGAWN